MGEGGCVKRPPRRGTTRCRRPALANREEPMNIPVLVLLGFAAWTLTILSVGVGAYRWSLLPSGRRVGDEGAGGQMRRLRFRGERRRAGLELEPRKTSGEGRGGFPLRRESRPRLHRPPRGRREIVGAAGGASTNHCRRGGA